MCEFKARGEAAFLASTMPLPWLLGSSLAIWRQPSEQVQYSPEPRAPPKTFQRFKSTVTVFRSPFCHWFISYRGMMLACVYPAEWRRPTSELRCCQMPRDSWQISLCQKPFSSWHWEQHCMRLRSFCSLALSSIVLNHHHQPALVPRAHTFISTLQSTLLVGCSTALKLFQSELGKNKHTQS